MGVRGSAWLLGPMSESLSKAAESIENGTTETHRPGMNNASAGEFQGSCGTPSERRAELAVITPREGAASCPPSHAPPSVYLPRSTIEAALWQGRAEGILQAMDFKNHHMEHHRHAQSSLPFVIHNDARTLINTPVTLQDRTPPRRPPHPPSQRSWLRSWMTTPSNVIAIVSLGAIAGYCLSLHFFNRWRRPSARRLPQFALHDDPRNVPLARLLLAAMAGPPREPRRLQNFFPSVAPRAQITVRGFAMNFNEAIDILTNKPGVEITSERLLGATNCLQAIPDEQAVQALSEIAFENAHDVARREAAMVLLRSRFLIWSPTVDSPLKLYIENGLARCLCDLGNPKLIWRVASLISAVVGSYDDNGNARWGRLVDAVMNHLQDEATRRTPELLYGALELVKAIFSDGLPEALMTGPPEYLQPLLLAGLTSQVRELQSLAFFSLAATLEAYAQKKDTVLKCQDLFGHLMKYLVDQLDNAPTNELDVCVRMLSSTVSVVDVNGPLRMTKVDIWNQGSLDTFLGLLRRSAILAWWQRGGPVGTKIVSHLCRLAAACLLTNTKNELTTRLCWDYLVHHLAYIHVGGNQDALENIIRQWELKRDDDEALSDLELPDESDDVCLVAWELIDRVLTALDGKTAKNMVGLTVGPLFEASPEDVESCGRIYAAWMILAILIGCKSDEVHSEEVRTGLNQWRTIINSRHRNDVLLNYAHARVRWAALLFMNEALEHFSELLTDRMDYVRDIIVFAHTEPIPRVKAKCYLALCQFATNLDETDSADGGKGQDYQQILSSTFKDWLIPQLTLESMLSTCKGVLGKEYGKSEESMAMEIYLRELTMCALSSCMPHLGQMLPLYYQPVVAYTRRLLSNVLEDSLADYVAEAVLDLLSRAVECAGAHLIQFSDRPGIEITFPSLEDDGTFLLRSILRIDRALESRERNHNPCLFKTGIYAQGFERTLLQAAARALAVLQTQLIRPEIQDLLNIVLRKLRVIECVTVVDRLLTGHGSKRLLTHDGTTATLVVNESRGIQKAININTSAVEEQIGCLAFVGVTADKIWPALTGAEKQRLTQALSDGIRESPFGLVKKAGMEALKEIGESIGRSMMKRAKSLDVTFNDHFGIHFDGLLADDEFVTLFRAYILKLKLALELGAQTLKLGEGTEDAGILYAMADMCDHAKELALFMGISILALGNAVPEVTEFGKIFHTLFAKLYTIISQDLSNQPQSPDVYSDEDEEEQKDGFGLRCDSVMQLFSRLARAFEQIAIPPFEEHLKAFFATILVTEDISLVARTAALCIFGNYLEVSGPSILANDLVPVSLVFTRARPVSDADAKLFRAYIPQLAAGRPSPDINENTLEDLGRALLQIGPAEKYAGMNIGEINSTVFDDYQPEVMKIQAACFCVGTAVSKLGDPQIVKESMPVVDDAFAALLDHPLAALASRRVILDCLACAYLKIVDQWGLQMMENHYKVFNPNGISSILGLLFPLVDDHEDACHAHNLLLKWALIQPPTGFPRLIHSENAGLDNGSVGKMTELECEKIRNEIRRIFQELKDDPENGDLLSDWAQRCGLPRI